LNSFLISIGSFPEQALPTVCSALSCGAARSVDSLDIFHISSASVDQTLPGLISAMNGFHEAVPDVSPDFPFFRTGFSFGFSTVILPSSNEITDHNDSGLLYTALRGKNTPLSFKTDREAVEWSFSYLLSERPNQSCDPLFTFIGRIQSALADGEAVRLALLCDLSDSFSAALAIVLLPWLRTSLNGDKLNIAMIALANPSLPDSVAVLPDIRNAVKELKNRSLLRNSEDESPVGADAMWFVSLPFAMVESNESHRLVFFSAARIIGRYFSSEKLPPFGLHTRRVSGTVSLHSLQDEAVPFAGFLLFSAWLLSDLLPSVVSSMRQEARPRPLRLNSRHSVFSSLFGKLSVNEGMESLLSIKEALISVLRECSAVIRSIPKPLRYSKEMEESWLKAVDSCGQYITVASEYDVAREDMEKSGLGEIRPVHRDSLADTEEELLVARLGQMAEQVKIEKAARDTVLSEVGLFRSFQARVDCMKKCESALYSAREKLIAESAADDHLSLARRERRIRLLQAAVDRSSSELFETEETSPAKAGIDVKEQPYLPVILSVRGYHSLSGLVSSQAGDMAAREMKDSLPFLLEGYTLPDARTLMKGFQQAYRANSLDDRNHPVGCMLSIAWAVCRSSVSLLRFHSVGNMPEVTLLPELLPSSPPLTLSGLLSVLDRHSALPEYDSGELRGLLAMLVLRLYKRRNAEEAELTAACLYGSTPVLKYWLSAYQADNVGIFSLSDENHQPYPFLMIVPAKALIPARRGASHSRLVPSFATWYNRNDDSFRDPVPDLSEGDRLLMAEWTSSVLDSLPDQADEKLKRFFQSFLEDIRTSGAAEIPDQFLSVRLQAVCGLRSLPAYRTILTRKTCVYENNFGNDPVATQCSGVSISAVSCIGIPEEVIYEWRGNPFARENSRRILESPHAAEEEYFLKVLKKECAVMADWSDDYRDQLIREAAAMLDRFPDALPESRDAASEIISKSADPLPDQSPELIWPWDPMSPSVITVFRECLGEVLSGRMLEPFSDKIAVFPARSGDIIGDSLFSNMCSVLPYAAGTADNPESFTADAVLPPLSAGMIQAVSCFPEARLLLTPDMIRLERPDESSLRVTLTLNGAFPLHLVRTYKSEEIVILFSQDIPTLAVWPSVPFPRGMWNAYFVYAHLPDGISVEILSGNNTSYDSMAGSDSRYTAVLQDFPSAFSILFEGRCIGTLPNYLPPPENKPAGLSTVCIDFGSVGTSVVFSSVTQRKPLRGPVMVRTILNNPVSSQELLRREFLPAVPVSALLPTVSRIFHNSPGSLPVPFSDGTILMSANIQDLLTTPSDALYTCLKWEEEKGRSGYICLHQVMLMAALQARIDGADHLAWRFAVPDEMAHEGRENLRTLFISLVDTVMKESGFPVPESGLPVTFATESAALGAYFRLCASEDTRGGFMVLDIGACTADISLFLRGREQAVRTCQIPLGIHYMLLPTLLRDPLLLKREFGNISDEAFQSDLNLLTQVLKDARKDSVSLRKARLALDHFLSDYYSLIISLMNQYRAGGIPTRFGAVLLLHVSYLMMLSGLVLLQIAADPNRNDFLPEQMSLCLSGRGSLILERMPDDIKSAVWHFLTMFRNRRVASLSLLFSAEKKMEIPVGLSILQDTYTQLPPASSVPASIAVRPEELLPEFLLRFARTFPLSASVLFPGFFSSDPYHPFSDTGESTVAAAIDQSFFDHEMPRPYNSLAAWIVNLLEDIPDPCT